MSEAAGFSNEQKEYLQGFVAGAEALRSQRGLPTFAATLGISANGSPTTIHGVSSAGGPAGRIGVEDIHREAQDRFLAAGAKLTAEDQAKRDKNPFEMWDEMRSAASENRFPKGTDVLLYKFHGLFFVAPAQNAFMCRLRFPGGISNAFQLRGIADIAERWGAGHTDVTTRANLQIREIGAAHGLDVITSLENLGIITRGAGADNIRNVTGTPTAGIDRQELLDTLPICREMHHYICHHREMYGLPRKFNIAFDGGGTISALADTNDIGFMAVRVGEDQEVTAGVYFRMELGGITGHQDFARDTGILLKPEECVTVAAAVVRVFIDNGDRTDRKKARLKYVLDRFGLEKYLEETQKHLKFPLRNFPLDRCEPRGPVARLAHVGFHPQKQEGLHYVGVVLPVGRMRVDQMRALADISLRYGSGSIRWTVWQNLLISDIPTDNIPEVKRAIEAAGLHWSATNVRAGLVACTGNAGCKYAASNTKRHALAIADYLDDRVPLDQPLNIHVTGCYNSCAQHYIGDIGLLATKVPVGEEMVEGYHVYIGGGYGEEREIGRELYKNVVADDIPPLVERMVLGYLNHRRGPDESFHDYTRREPTETLLQHFQVEKPIPA
jgi:ferredoxin-nitrite reductase